MKRWMIRISVLGLALGILGFLVAASGVIPIRASAGHWAITEWFLQFSQRRSVAAHSLGTDVPPLDDPGLVLKGATHYDFGCRSCHGSPGERPPRIAQSMLPAPPPLGPHVRNSSAAELFEVVKHGLKFTGMPAWPAQQRDDEVWAMVAFLLTLPDLDQTGYQRLVKRTAPATAPIEKLTPTETVLPVPAGVIRTCVSCHGEDGLGRDSPVFPKLAGQKRDYLENALLAYAQGERHSGIMEPIAAGLSEEMMRELADYYSRLNDTLPDTEPPPPPTRDQSTLDLGRSIALNGIPDRLVPACIECHGPRGQRTKSAYPTLAGQPADYLVLQLELFKRNQRGGSPYAHLMQEVAPHLEAEEMRAVANYFESLPSPRE